MKPNDEQIQYNLIMGASHKKPPKHHHLLWVVEPLMDEPSYLQKPMFGCLAIYFHYRLVLMLASGDEPWNGLLIPTDHRFHASIHEEWPDIKQHPVLKKWLYLPEMSENFENVAGDLVEAIRMHDERLGVEPHEKPAKKKKTGLPGKVHAGRRRI